MSLLDRQRCIRMVILGFLAFISLWFFGFLATQNTEMQRDVSVASTSDSTSDQQIPRQRHATGVADAVRGSYTPMPLDPVTAPKTNPINGQQAPTSTAMASHGMAEEITLRSESFGNDQEIYSDASMDSALAVPITEHDTDEILTQETTLVITDEQEARRQQLREAMENLWQQDASTRQQSLQDIWLLAADTDEIATVLVGLEAVNDPAIEHIRDDLIRLQQENSLANIPAYVLTATRPSAESVEVDGLGLTEARVPVHDAEERLAAQEVQYRLQSDALYGSNPEQRFQALGQLAQYRDLTSAQDTLRQAVTDDSPGNRRLAVEILARVAADQPENNAAIQHTLEQASGDADPGVGLLAREALAYLQKEVP